MVARFATGLAGLALTLAACLGAVAAPVEERTAAAPSASGGALDAPTGRTKGPTVLTVPAPRPVVDSAARARRGQRIKEVRSWGIQLQELDLWQARQVPYDMLVVDGTAGIKGGTPFDKEKVEGLKAKPDGGRRMLISYLSIGEAEDYREDYFNAEYMTEDAPDWLLNENERWKGNRRIRFCEEGWQRTILGDDDGRNLYNSVEPSPLYRLIEEGFDGVYLDRVDVYSEVEKECPDAARKMVAFVARLAAHARKKNPDFMIILQNAEELLQHKEMVATIDAVAKEDLFYGAGHTESANEASMVRDTLKNLLIARDAGKPVFVLDYLSDPAKRATDRAKIEAQGFVPYFGPRALDKLWLQENRK